MALDRLEAGGCEVCVNATQITLRYDCAPSPQSIFRPTYAFHHIKLSTLLSSSCHQCRVLGKGVLHFAQQFPSPTIVNPSEVIVSCTGPPARVVPRLGGWGKWLDVPKRSEGEVPDALRITFWFADNPGNGIDLMALSSLELFKPKPSYEEHVSDCLSIVASWISKCMESHGPKCASASPSTLPTRLLDVRGNAIRLIDTTNLSASEDDNLPNYIALSHCWGADTMSLKTTRANIAALQKSINPSQLPRTFQDAVLVTRHLGLGFVWIDSLCIIQDDHSDWERESGRMATIYQNAFLTLAATHSTDSNGGLFVPFSAKPYLWVNETSCEKILGSRTNSNIWETLRVDTESPVRFARHFALRPRDDIRDSTPRRRQEGRSTDILATGYPLLTRGWVFQERLLSPRVVHFGNTQLAWECRCSLWTESLLFTSDRHDGGRDFPLEFSPGTEDPEAEEDIPFVWSSSRVPEGRRPRKKVEEVVYAFEWTRRQFIGTLARDARVSLQGDQILGDVSAAENNVSTILGTWNTIVEDYSRLTLTDEMDYLPALSGIATSIHSSLTRHGSSNATYVAGVWSPQLPQGLCWICTSERPTRPARYRAPSFSWASIDGAISFRQSLALKRRLDRRLPMGYTCCEVLSVSSQPEGLDRYGRVFGGNIELRGWTSIGHVSKVYRTEKGVAYLLQMGSNNNIQQKFWPDVAPPLDQESGKETQLKILLLECVKLSDADATSPYRVMCLVLRPSETFDGAWERIGLIHPADEMPLYLDFRGDLAADIGNDRSMFENPSLWFTGKETLIIR